MKFTDHGVGVNRVRIRENVVNELQYCSLLCYTGNCRESATIIESQVSKFNKGQNEDALDKTKALAKEMSVAMERGDIRTAGEILDEAWVFKKQFSTKVSNPHIDAMYEAAKRTGAIGGKVSGAEGAGSCTSYANTTASTTSLRSSGRWVRRSPTSCSSPRA